MVEKLKDKDEGYGVTPYGMAIVSLETKVQIQKDKLNEAIDTINRLEGIIKKLENIFK